MLDKEEVILGRVDALNGICENILRILNQGRGIVEITFGIKVEVSNMISHVRQLV